MARRSWRIAASITLFVSCAGAAHAEPFEFTLNGELYGVSLGSTPLANGTPFTETALFDTSTPNLLSFIPGSAAYVPSAASITINGTNYQITPFAAATPYGVAVVIFDQSSPFPVSPEYGVALIGNPLLDGAGILADFTAASPNFTANNLVTTTFAGSDYVGSGEASGVCIDSAVVCNNPNVYHDNSVQPFPLTSNGVSTTLTFPDEVLITDINYVNDPNAPPPGATLITNAPSTAALADLPEPSSWLMLGFGLAAISMMARVRRG